MFTEELGDLPVSGSMLLVTGTTGRLPTLGGGTKTKDLVVGGVMGILRPGELGGPVGGARDGEGLFLEVGGVEGPMSAPGCLGEQGGAGDRMEGT